MYTIIHKMQIKVLYSAGHKPLRKKRKPLRKLIKKSEENNDNTYFKYELKTYGTKRFNIISFGKEVDHF